MKARQASAWYVLGLLAVANFLHYANRNVVVTMYEDLRAIFAFDNAELGLLTTAFMVTHAPATVFFGWLSDRVDRRRVLAFGIFVWSVSALACALVDGIATMLVARALVGLGTAACVPVANALICDYVEAAHKARAVSTFNFGLFLGGAMGTFLGAKLGFPIAFVILGAPGIAIGALIFRLRLGSDRMTEESLPRGAGESSVASILRIRTYRFTTAGAILMAFAAGAYLAWFFDFLQLSVDLGGKGATEDEALLILGVSLVTGLLGVISGGLLGDKLCQTRAYGRQAAVALGITASVPLALAVIFLPLGAAFYICSWLLMFTISWYHGPLAASVDDLVPSQNAGLAQGFYIAAMHLFGTASAPYLVGLVAGKTSLQAALLLPTGAMVLAGACFIASFGGVQRDLVVKR